MEEDFGFDSPSDNDSTSSGSHYIPEMGQAVFGQPWQPLEVNNKTQAALDALQNAWDASVPTNMDPNNYRDNPFSNTGFRYDGKCFKAHAYSWGDDDQEFNFAWRDFRVSWYKYLGRGTTCNRHLSKTELKEMLSECLAEIVSLGD